LYDAHRVARETIKIMLTQAKIEFPYRHRLQYMQLRARSCGLLLPLVR
jgi:hypothetical protein